MSRLTAILLIVSIILFGLALLYVGFAPARAWTARPNVQAHEQRMASVHPTDDPPIPLPRDCDGVTPPGAPPPACCIRGYAYYSGEPVAGASVHIESLYGALDISTAIGARSNEPYYSADLSSSPLSVSAGDVITITVTYSDMVSIRAWTVQTRGQHVDLGLIAGYQASGPVSVRSVGVLDTVSGSSGVSSKPYYSANLGSAPYDGNASTAYQMTSAGQQIDVLISQSVELVGQLGGVSRAVVVQDHYVYMGLGSQDTSEYAHDLHVSGNYTYIADEREDSTILRFTDGTLPTPGWHVECVDCPKFFDEMTDRNLDLDTDGHPHIAYGGNHLYYAWHDGSQWHTEVVDAADGVGRFVSLALDSANHPHFGYYDATNNDLKYAFWDGTSWDVQTVDWEGEVGLGASLALDSAGRPHIVYYNRTDSDLKYAHWNGTGWVIEVADSTASWWWWGQASLALDSQDRPHVSYYQGADGSLMYATKPDGTWNLQIIDPQTGSTTSSIAMDLADQPHVSYGVASTSPHELRYASLNGASWQTQTITLIGEWGGLSSLAFDSTGQPHIGFQDWNGYRLRYAIWDGNEWVIADIGSVGWWGGRNSLALDGSDRPHIAYNDWSSFEIRYAVKDGVTWTWETVDVGGYVGDWSSLDVDVSGHPHMSYRDIPPLDLKYAFHSGATWSRQTVDDAWGAGEHTSLALDSAGRPHIGYRGDYHLRYTHWDGIDWTIQIVDASGNVGEYTSLALDSNERPHMSYHDWDNQALKYATWDGQTWITRTVDKVGYGAHCSQTSIAIDPDDYPYIAYYDAYLEDLKVAHWAGASWVIQTVDSEGNVGCSPAIAFDSSGQPHVAYYDTSEGKLKYASWDGATWHIQTVTSQNAWGPRSNLSLDAADRPHIAYTDGTATKSAQYAYWNGAQWIVETIDDDGDVGSFISLALDSSGFPHVSYGDSTNGGLKYAWRYSAPTAAFTAAPRTGSAPLNVRFTDQSTGDIIAWDWTFGDGGVSGARHPEHEYTDSSIFTVSLTISGPSASDTETRVDYITVASQPGETPWVFLLYLDGDNNLYYWLQRALDNLEAASANPNLTVLALLDGYSSRDTWRYHVQPGGNYTDGVNRWYMNELNMGEPQTLSDFITWARDKYPAEHYYLAVADHGRGTTGIAWDDTSGSQAFITVAELRNALQAATSNGADPLDVVHYDACLMAMIENAYQIKDYAGYLVASENLGWSIFAYERYAAQVTAGMTPEGLATAVVDEYHNVLAEYPRTISALNLAQAERVADAVTNLATALQADLDANKFYVRNTRDATQKFDSRGYFVINNEDEYLDLYDLARLLEQNVPDSGVQNAAQGVMDAVTAFVVAERHESGYYQDYPYWDLEDTHGVAIYFPPASGGWGYSDYMSHVFRFTAEGQWDEFLQAYYGLMGLPPETPVDPGVPPVLEWPFTIHLPIVIRQ